jgi:hypothetical protein
MYRRSTVSRYKPVPIWSALPPSSPGGCSASLDDTDPDETESIPGRGRVSCQYASLPSLRVTLRLEPAISPPDRPSAGHAGRVV